MRPEEIGIIAVAISALSFLVSGISLGWNIYRDIVLKPKLMVRVNISFIQHGEKRSGEYISISAVNLGPREIFCRDIYMAKLTILRFLRINCFNKYCHIVYDFTNPYSSELPRKLAVGETMNLFLPYNQEAFLSANPTHVGITDSYGRCHWASKSSLKKAKKSYFKKFQKTPWGS